MKAQLTQGATAVTNLQDYTLRCQLIGNLVSEADLTAGLDFYVLPLTASAAPGIALLPYVTGSATTTIAISDQLSILLKAAFDLAGGILVSIRPNQPVGLSTGIFGGTPGSAACLFRHPCKTKTRAVQNRCSSAPQAPADWNMLPSAWRSASAPTPPRPASTPRPLSPMLHW